jgi:hypothetical protein
MSYLKPHFDPDIFVSYSHGNPQGGQAPLRDWTRDLVSRLKAGLRALQTEFDDLQVWMDPDVDPTAYLTDELKEKAGGCGILMIVMSNRYLESSWCKDELGWFQSQVEARPVGSGRVFVLRAQKTDESHWPEFLRDTRGHAMIGFTFHDSEADEPWGFQLDKPGDEYFRALSGLRVWLTRRLRETRDRAHQAQVQARAATATQRVGPRLIYLHAPPGADLVRADVEQALKSHGIEPVTASAGASSGLGDWQIESRKRVGMAKQCEALALLRVNDDRFEEDLLGICVNERKEMTGPRGLLSCAVLDKTGESLPTYAASFGIERFDVNGADWPSGFRRWLDATRVSAPVVAE